MITAKECADAIVNGSDERKRLIVTPAWYHIFVFARKLFPSLVDGYFTKAFGGKKTV
jgi:short-subunit dehydrogenase